MFGPDWSAGCPVCSSIADTLDPQVVHLQAKDATLLLASRAPLGQLLAFKEADGLGHRLGLQRRQRLQPRRRFPEHTGGAEAVSGRRDSFHRRAERAHVWDGCGRVRLRGTGPERVRAGGRQGLPDLRHDRPRPRARDGLLRAAGPDAEGSRRERRGAVVGCAATTSTRTPPTWTSPRRTPPRRTPPTPRPADDAASGRHARTPR